MLWWPSLWARWLGVREGGGQRGGGVLQYLLSPGFPPLEFRLTEGGCGLQSAEGSQLGALVSRQSTVLENGRQELEDRKKQLEEVRSACKSHHFLNTPPDNDIFDLCLCTWQGNAPSLLRHDSRCPV